MTNPVITARLSMGLTRLDLAQEANIALMTMTYIELGSYGTLPQRVALILEPVSHNSNGQTLSEEYEEWKMRRRMATSIFDNLLTYNNWGSFPELDDIMHPHEEFRGLIGVPLNRYAMEICVARNVIQNFETGRQHGFPSPLSNALV